MATIGGYNVVTDGLVLSLDAANRNSYVSGSSTWFDVSGNRNSGSLVNGPGFDSGNGGSLVFDGTNDYCTVNSSSFIPYQSNPRSINIWFYTNSTSWLPNNNNLFFYGTGSNGQAFGIDFDSYPRMEVYTWGGVGRDLIFNTTYNQVGWKNMCVTYNGVTTILVYENGIQTQTLTLVAQCNTFFSNLYIGSINPSIFAGYFEGKISQLSIYNRALTPEEVSQNYNATKGRFGL